MSVAYSGPTSDRIIVGRRCVNVTRQWRSVKGGLSRCPICESTAMTHFVYLRVNTNAGCFDKLKMGVSMRWIVWQQVCGAHYISHRPRGEDGISDKWNRHMYSPFVGMQFVIDVSFLCKTTGKGFWWCGVCGFSQCRCTALGAPRPGHDG